MSIVGSPVGPPVGSLITSVTARAVSGGGTLNAITDPVGGAEITDPVGGASITDPGA